MSLVGRIFGYVTKPKTLGEGLKRVVKAAGNGKSGKCVRQGLPYMENVVLPFGPYMGRAATREYSNGVKIYASDCFNLKPKAFSWDEAPRIKEGFNGVKIVSLPGGLISLKKRSGSETILGVFQGDAMQACRQYDKSSKITLFDKLSSRDLNIAEPPEFVERFFSILKRQV